MKKERYQYAIVHSDTSSFNIGDIVFHKSNPEAKMKVIAFGKRFIKTSWENKAGKRQSETFPCTSLLHYKNAALFIWKDKYIVSYN